MMRGIVQTICYVLADAFAKRENGYRFLGKYEAEFHDADIPAMPREWEGIRVTVEAILRKKPAAYHEGYIMNAIASWSAMEDKKDEDK